MKAGSKSGKNKDKKLAAGVSKAKGKKGCKKKTGKKEAKKSSEDSKEKGEFKEKEKNDPCKLVIQEICHSAKMKYGSHQFNMTKVCSTKILELFQKVCRHHQKCSLCTHRL